MKGMNIPVPIIVLCFVFGAWPVGVVLAILRIMRENSDANEAEERRRKEYMRRAGLDSQNWQSPQGTGRVSNYRAPGMDNAVLTGAVDIDTLRQRAMYTSRANLDAMSEHVTNVEFSKLIKIAPFLSREALGRLAERAQYVDAHSLIQLAPFLSEQTLDILVERADGMTVQTITALAPFLSQNTLTRLAGRKYDQGTSSQYQKAETQQPRSTQINTTYSVPQGIADTVNSVLREVRSAVDGSMRTNGNTGYVAPPPFVSHKDANTQRTQNGAQFTQSGTAGQSGKRSFIPSVRKFTSTATVLSTIALVPALIISLIVFLSAVGSIGTGIGNVISSVISAMIMSSISAMVYLFRRYCRTRDYRIMSYLSTLRGERFYSIQKLADITDTSTSRVIKDLQYMYSKGLLSDEAVIDRKLGYVILFKDARPEAEEEAYGGDINRFVKPKAKTPDEAAAEMSEHEKILRRIRELNDDIDDVAVSEKIDKIEELTRKIFKLVEEKPEMEPQLGSFLSYYLPTTLKLLNSYAYFEDQGIRGENIDEGMRNIEATLDMLIDGYKTQFDKLFEAEALDVSTDINVLEQMMRADGFTRSEDFNVGAQTAQGEMFSGSVAFAQAPDEEEKRE